MGSRDADPKLLLFKIKRFLHKFSGFHVWDGVGGTLKILAAGARLQRPFSEEILIPKQLFEFTNSEITGATIFFVNSPSVKENIPFLESRFQIAAPSRELARIMSLFQVEKTLL